MSAFRALDDVSKYFATNLKQTSVSVAVRAGDKFEDAIARKLEDLALFTSKLRLLRAKPISLTQPLDQQNNEKSTISRYGDTVTQKLIEQQIVKSLTQSHAVRKLLTTDTSQLDPDLLDRKQNILTQLDIYKEKETQLRLMDAQLTEKQRQYDSVRERWHELLRELKEMQRVDNQKTQDNPDPLYRKLQSLVSRMEMFRFLISKFITCRTTNYDWLTDPDDNLPILKLTRQPNTVAMFRDK